MGNTRKLMAASFVAGVAAAAYASRHINKNSPASCASENNAYETYTAPPSASNNPQTAAQKNNYFSAASPSGIDYQYDSSATNFAQTAYNLYHDTEDKPPFASTAFTNSMNNSTGSTEPGTKIRIDAK